ncbi:MAG: hypothetical protein AMXMBFR74_16660 [Parvibaculum sp.]|uniref:hypothetical protein n=1 Tax=Parvibaculum sp. TaxID=2024848 RepID=UPI0035BA6F0F
MIESLMLIALGFLIATLFALIGAQFVWRRAVTVTLRKMAPDGEADTDAAEDRQAELDSLLRRHERELAPMQADIRNLRAESARLAAENEALEMEKAQLSADSDALRAEGEGLRSTLAALRERIDRAAAETAKRAASVAVASRELSGLEQALAAEARHYEAAREELAALEAPAAPAEESYVPQALEPYSPEEQDEDARTLAEVKASLLAEIDGTPEGTARRDEDDEDEAPANGPSLAERIRALEAGVAH